MVVGGFGVGVDVGGFGRMKEPACTAQQFSASISGPATT